MAKRSPILGYNHNVRYRGLVFHVQTEDSGVLSPHLFTHMFHHGVIVSTRKLVYDSGSAEDSIKALMQAQHKAVLKDLKRGTFDDKIDEYLGGTLGLLPRDHGVAIEAAESVEPTDPERPQLTRASSPLVPAPPILPEGHIIATTSAKPTESDLTMARSPTLDDPQFAATVRATPDDPALGRRATAEHMTSSIGGGLPTAEEDAEQRSALASDFTIDSSPEILIQLELDEPDDEISYEANVSSDDDDYSRPTVDVSQLSDGIPGIMPGGATLRTPGDLIPPLLPSSFERRASTAVGAAALPPARPITRPPNRPAMTPPQVISRPLPPSERRSHETDAIEVYAPPPPSAELPGERPGQYSQHKRVSERIPADIIKETRRTPPPGVPIPSGLGRPGASRNSPMPTAQAPRAPSAQPPIPQPPPRNFDQTPPVRSRTPTPVRIASPTQSRTATSSSNSTSTNSSSGVVMTRPAVIVGAPTRPATTTTQRVRKAREDEGRGFGQGLISEKSLDEVILAYLSEDADEK